MSDPQPPAIIADGAPVPGIVVGFRKAEKRDQEWHEPLPETAALGLDGHYPDWLPWQVVTGSAMVITGGAGSYLERRVCRVYRCGLDDVRETTASADPPVPEFLTSDRSIGVSVTLGGRGVDLLAPPPPCQHRTFSQQVTVARLVDDDGARVGTQAQVKVRCSECGAPARFLLRSAGVESDRRTLTCLVEFEADDGEAWIDAQAFDDVAQTR